MSRVSVSMIRQALERIERSQRAINGGFPSEVHPRLKGHSSDFIYGAAWALQWVLQGDADSGPAGKLAE